MYYIYIVYLYNRKSLNMLWQACSRENTSPKTNAVHVYYQKSEKTCDTNPILVYGGLLIHGRYPRIIRPFIETTMVTWGYPMT